MIRSQKKDFRIRILPQTADDEFLRILKAVDVDPYAQDIMLPKMKHLNILLPDIECKVANIIKQQMLSLDGDAAVARGTVACSIPATDVILMGTAKQIGIFAAQIKTQPFGLKYLSEKLESVLANFQKTDHVLCTNQREIQLGKRTQIMGVVNVTPDSFSDGGKYLSTQAATDRALQLEAEGADIIDIGGESSRPGSEFISATEELKRIIPVIKGLYGKLSVPVSVDTLKAEVAEAAIAEGAEIVNDISSMTFDERMASVISESKVAVVLMHMKGIPKTMQEGPIAYADLMGDIIRYLAEQIKNARSHGIQAEKIVVDPGVGFGKTVRDNLSIIRNLSELKIFGMPILTGVSRKSFIGSMTNVGNPAERLEGTAAAITASILNGSHLVRVHDVGSTKKIIAMADAIVHG
jgi:dihydropteroate synthase